MRLNCIAPARYRRLRSHRGCHLVGGQHDVADSRRLTPVERRDALGWDAPALEVQVDANRHDVARTVGALQLGDGGLVEMVVVVVADEDRVEGRQVSDAARIRVQATRTDAARW